MQQINQGLITSPGIGECGVSLQEAQPITNLGDEEKSIAIPQAHERTGWSRSIGTPGNGGAYNQEVAGGACL